MIEPKEKTMGTALIESLQRQIKILESMHKNYEEIISLKDRMIALDEKHIKLLEDHLGIGKTKPGSFTATGSIEDVSTEMRKENP